MISLVIALLIILIALVAGLIMFRKRVDLSQKDNAVVSKMVHDIRTPMSVIKTNCEIAMMNPGLDSEIKKKMEDIVGELDKISAILMKASQDMKK